MRAIKQEYEASAKIDRLLEHPDNPRLGNDDVVADSVDIIGFYGAVVAQKSTGYVLAGNTRLRVARANGAKTLPVVWVDVDEDTAKKILLVDNRASDLAQYDDDVLAKLLSDLSDTANLLGTGYDQLSLEALLATTAIEEVISETGLRPTVDERREAFEAHGIRSIILPFGADEYGEVVDLLSALRKKYSVETNSEAVLRLLQEELT